MNFQLVGCSHHNASIEMRERLAFSTTQAARALDLWRERFPAAEAVLLSTCNRVEVYSASEAEIVGPNHEQVAEFLSEFHGLEPDALGNEFFQQSGEAAVWHLFMVTASLDSLVLGEPQILAQVKQAYQLAQQRHSAGPLTHDMFQAALRVAKRVSRETSLYEKRVSIPSVAIGDFARQIFDSFDDKRVLVIGAGEMGQETLRYLARRGGEGCDDRQSQCRSRRAVGRTIRRPGGRLGIAGRASCGRRFGRQHHRRSRADRARSSDSLGSSRSAISGRS